MIPTVSSGSLRIISVQYGVVTQVYIHLRVFILQNVNAFYQYSTFWTKRESERGGRLLSTWLQLSCCHGATLPLKTLSSVRKHITIRVTETYKQRERKREREMPWKRRSSEERRKGGVCYREEEEEEEKEGVSSTEREKEHRNTRTKSIWSQYTMNIQYVSHQKLPSPKCHIFSSLEKQLKLSWKCFVMPEDGGPFSHRIAVRI